MKAVFAINKPLELLYWKRSSAFSVKSLAAEYFISKTRTRLREEDLDFCKERAKYYERLALEEMDIREQRDEKAKKFIETFCK